MGMRSFQFSLGEFYHLYNRGVEKRTIYLDFYDHQRFVELLYVANTTTPVNLRNLKRDKKSVFDWERGDSLVAIGSYCLMPNHFHILLTPLQEGGVSTFMNKLCTSYSMYFNKKYKRTGSLFEGKYKAKYVDSDEYLKYLFSYIHLNPVKLIQSDWKEKGIKNVSKAYTFASSFKYSSLSDYQNNYRPESVIINQEYFPDYFSGTTSQKEELLSWLEYKE